MWAPQAYWQQLGCVCVRHDQRRFPINVPPGFPLPVVLLPAPATVLSEVSGPVQPSQCTTPHSAEVGWTAPRIRQAMSFAGVWNLEATLTEQDVKTAIFGIGFEPMRLSTMAMADPNPRRALVALTRSPLAVLFRHG